MKVGSLSHFLSPGETLLSGREDLLLQHLNTLASLEDSKVQKRLLENLIYKYVLLEKRVDDLLKNTLPASVAEEIKYYGRFAPRVFDCTILFSDFVSFTQLAERVPGEELIMLLHRIFTGMDDLVEQFQGTKIKTIGDAYMAVFGAPRAYENHALQAVTAGLALQQFLHAFNRETGCGFRMRVGIHTGKVMAGVVGKERMQFDIFGDNVNIAARFESSGEPGKVNVSHDTYLKARSVFEFEKRGPIRLKNKPPMDAYFALREAGA